MDTGRLENPLSKTRTNSKLMKLWHLAKYQSRATRIRSKCPMATTNTLIQPLNYIREVQENLLPGLSTAQTLLLQNYIKEIIAILTGTALPY